MWAVRCCGKHHGIRRCLLAAGVLAVVCVALLVGCGGVLPDFEPAGSGAAGETEALAAGIDTVGRGELPPEAMETIEFVESGGPFPYAKDGTVFHNYEGLLPQKSDGYYGSIRLSLRVHPTGGRGASLPARMASTTIRTTTTRASDWWWSEPCMTGRWCSART
jgi:guanyl-specific ribonuclease Sa